MNMRAHLLARFCGSKCPNDWHLWPVPALGNCILEGNRRVELGGRSLIMIDAVQTDPKDLHPV